MEITRRKSRKICLGGVYVGGDAPVSIQSMLSVKTSMLDDSSAQMIALEKAGCEIIRFSVMDPEDAAAIPKLKECSSMPMVADIHFDYKLALLALENGIDGLRINPGNIGSREGVERLVKLASERRVPIRIGVNSGSLPQDLLAAHGVCAQSMVEAAMRHVRILEDLGFEQIKISAKASHLGLMLDSYRRLAQICDYPLHLGVTEAGTLVPGTVKSSLGLGMLLSEGIGDTIRVSLTADPAQEIRVAREILKNLGLRRGLNIVSCPTCGRTRINLIELAGQVEAALAPYEDQPLDIAVMGCVVNGPGEAREADFGIAGGQGEGLLFARGEIVAKLPEGQLVEALVRMVREHVEAGSR